MKGLNPSTTDYQLWTAFRPFNSTEAKIPPNQDHRKARHGLVMFPNTNDAKKALESFAG